MHTLIFPVVTTESQHLAVPLSLTSAGMSTGAKRLVEPEPTDPSPSRDGSLILRGPAWEQRNLGTKGKERESRGRGQGDLPILHPGCKASPRTGDGQREKSCHLRPHPGLSTGHLAEPSSGGDRTAQPSPCHSPLPFSSELKHACQVIQGACQELPGSGVSWPVRLSSTEHVACGHVCHGSSSICLSPGDIRVHSPLGGSPAWQPQRDRSQV